MNFLAHAYLSFGYNGILVGNLITDFVGAYHKRSYSTEVQTGVTLHHKIDSFTDTHETTRKAREYLRPATGRYCGVFLDVVYDHFLANDKSCFSSLTALADFSQNTYQTLEAHPGQLPEKFKWILKFMKQEDWLYNYHTKEGIRKSFAGIYRRANYLKKSDAAFESFLESYDNLQQAYFMFMPAMKKHAQGFLQEKGYS